MTKEKIKTINGHLLALTISSSTISMYGDMCRVTKKVPKSILESIKESIKIQKSEIEAIEKLMKGEKDDKLDIQD